MTQAPFKSDGSFAPIPIKDVVTWTRDSSVSRLFLTPIQRSVVWRNSQIINYWDSLLRGYPAGLMMVHRRKDEASRARTLCGDTCPVRADDFQLFDGQQRLTTILLGLGEGQLNGCLKLWVDLASETPENSDLRFILRITSTGQPFGYQASAANEKQPLHKRRDKADEWMKRFGLDRFNSRQVFAEAGGNDLIDAKCAIPLQEITSLVLEEDATQASAILQARYPTILADRLEIFVQALARALSTPVLFQVIDREVIEQEDNYIRFFGRLGQGGTALTNDELTYSIIKHQYPEVHQRIREITDGPTGRVVGEVNLVLAALRVAKVSAKWDNSDDWQIYGRPHPASVSRLKEQSGVREEFQRMIPVASGGRLKQLLESIRQRLEYNKATNPGGLPVILLARLPHQLVDVLLLMESHRQPEENKSHSLPAFVLYWLLFIVDSEKAANIIFRQFCLKKANWQPGSDKNLIRLFEKEGVSRRLPGFEHLDEVRNEIRCGTHLLRNWGERFVTLDANKEHLTGDALRVLSTNGELIRRALLWLQRDYLAGRFPDYDPTSSRDEDLPIDLDHLIPHTKFGEDWRHQQKRLSFPDEKENFRHLRWTVGNSLGNFRWLDASDNRSRQANTIENTEGERDIIMNVSDWNALIEKNSWAEDAVATFQKMIDLRTITIYEHLLIAGGLKDFVTEPETVSDEPVTI